MGVIIQPILVCNDDPNNHTHMFSPVASLAGQCAVSNADVATVTSMISFFRSMGGVANVAIGGSMINNVLTQEQIDPNNYMDVYSHPDKYALATRAVFRQCK